MKEGKCTSLNRDDLLNEYKSLSFENVELKHFTEFSDNWERLDPSSKTSYKEDIIIFNDLEDSGRSKVLKNRRGYSGIIVHPKSKILESYEVLKKLASLFNLENVL